GQWAFGRHHQVGADVERHFAHLSCEDHAWAGFESLSLQRSFRVVREFSDYLFLPLDSVAVAEPAVVDDNSPRVDAGPIAGGSGFLSGIPDRVPAPKHLFPCLQAARIFCSAASRRVWGFEPVSLVPFHDRITVDFVPGSVAKNLAKHRHSSWRN